MYSRLAADGSPAGPVADDVVGGDRRDVLQIGRRPELGEEFGSPAGCEEFLEPGFAFAGFHLRTSEFARESWIQGASDRADIGSARRLPAT
jgi:hypothetical protein